MKTLKNLCTHTFLYEDPTWEHLRCFDCGEEVEPEDD